MNTPGFVEDSSTSLNNRYQPQCNARSITHITVLNSYLPIQTDTLMKNITSKLLKILFFIQKRHKFLYIHKRCMEYPRSTNWNNVCLFIQPRNGREDRWSARCIVVDNDSLTKRKVLQLQAIWDRCDREWLIDSQSGQAKEIRSYHSFLHSTASFLTNLLGSSKHLDNDLIIWFLYGYNLCNKMAKKQTLKKRKVVINYK